MCGSFSDTLAFLSEARQSTLLALFLEALTRSGPSGLPRPTELHAHDPIRYVGDMLAWVHQAIAAECDFLESLFGLKGQTRMVRRRTDIQWERRRGVGEGLVEFLRGKALCASRHRSQVRLTLQCRFESYKLSAHKKAVSYRTEPPIWC